MMKAILNWLGGWQTVSADAEHTPAVLNHLQEGHFLHWHMQNTADGGISFRMRSADAKIFVLHVPDVSADPVQGLPALRMRYRGRFGILFGALLFALIVYLSGTVVWEVSVTGNEALSAETVVRMLEEYGFGVGTRFGNIDFDVLQNDFLLTTDEIAWIAINMEGTVARVEIRENLGVRKKRPGGAANMVAAEDGQILEVRMVGGRAAVARGDIVRKGDLLIGGLLTVGQDGLRYEYADGEVLAQVNRVITAESPLIRTENVPTGSEKQKKTVRFFDKSVKLFINTGITYANYDTIIENRQLSLPFGIPLPVWITTETVRELRAETVTVSEERAFADAMILYRQEMDKLLSDAEILSIDTQRICADGVCRIVGRAVCVADIARAAEIEVQ